MDHIEALWPNGRPDSGRLKACADDMFLSMGLKISYHDGVCATAPTGEKYICLESQGVRLDGSARDKKTIPATRDEAVIRYMEMLSRLAAGKAGTVYWRCWPNVEPLYHGWSVYSRLLISDKPVIENGSQEMQAV